MVFEKSKNLSIKASPSQKGSQEKPDYAEYEMVEAAGGSPSVTSSGIVRNSA
jgi:hypothetical protein